MRGRLPSLVVLLLTVVSTAAGSEIAVIDGDTLSISGPHYRLHGIDAPEAGQLCEGSDGVRWPCGNVATARLTALVLNTDVRCEGQDRDDYDRILAVCWAGPTELNATMVTEGLAWAFRRYSSDYVSSEGEAAASGLGIWQATTQTPWDYRSERWSVAIQTSPDGCPIKGNISSNGHVYHAPWSPWYDRTKVSVERGERWFCSEREALDAGWRAPIWGGL